MTARKSPRKTNVSNLLSERANKAKLSAAGSNFLSPEDIIRGGDKFIREVVVKGLEKDGADGRLYHLPISAERMIKLQEESAEANKAQKEGENPRHVERMVEFLAETICYPDGSLMFTKEQLVKAPGDKLVAIMGAVTDSEAQGKGN